MKRKRKRTRKDAEENYSKIFERWTARVIIFSRIIAVKLFESFKLCVKVYEKWSSGRVRIDES